MIGCPVCGYGVDWSWWPDWLVIKCPSFMVYFEVGWMRYEYLCHRCWLWAKAAGACRDDRLPELTLTGWKLRA